MKKFIFLCVSWLSATQANAQVWAVRTAESIVQAAGSRVGSIAVDDSFVYVLDIGAGHVAKYTHGGVLKQAIGRIGTNAGEFSKAATHLEIIQGRITLIDPFLQRITSYENNGVFAGQRELGIHHATAQVWASGGRALYLLTPPIPAGYGFEEETDDHVVWALDPTGAAPARAVSRFRLQSSMSVSAGGQISVNLSVPEALLAGRPDGTVVLALSDTYAITFLDSLGNRVGGSGRSVAVRPYTKDEQRVIIEKADSVGRSAFAAGSAASGGSADEIKIDYIAPRSAPLITGLLAGETLTLVGRDTKMQMKPSEWDVLDSTGRFQGTVVLPAGFRAMALRRNKVWGVTSAGGAEIVMAMELIAPATR